MAIRTPPVHLLGNHITCYVRRGVVRRLHNRRISMGVTLEGDYQLHIAKALAPGEAAELREQGHVDTFKDYIVRDRVRYSMVTLSAEAFRAAVECWQELEEQRKRKRA
jgi:hypothetical protein